MKNQIDKTLLILDTNIVNYATQPWLSKQTEEFLRDLRNRNFELAISSITVYEILKKSEINIDLIESIKVFKSYEVNDDILLVASYLFTMFSKQNIDMDCIIAATVCINNSHLLTANSNDFPYPFFTEVEAKSILYKELPYRTKHVMFYLLKPNNALIAEKIRERVSKSKKMKIPF